MVKLLAAAGVVGLVVAGLGMASMRSDIQLIIAAVGFFSAIILFGLAAVLERMKALARD